MYPFIVGFNTRWGAGVSTLTADNAGFTGGAAPVAGDAWVVMIAVTNSSVVFTEPPGYTLHSQVSATGLTMAMFTHECAVADFPGTFSWSGSGDAVLVNLLLEADNEGDPLELDGNGTATANASTSLDLSIIDPYWGDESDTSYMMFQASTGAFSNFTTDSSGFAATLFAIDSSAEIGHDALSMFAWDEGDLSPTDFPGSKDPGTVTYAGASRNRVGLGIAFRVKVSAPYWGILVGPG